MARSMTGYGSSRLRVEQRQVNCQIKSVNNRFLDIQLNLPPSLAGLEASLRQRLRERLERGKVELRLKIQDDSEEAIQVYCDIPLARAYKQALEELGALLERPSLVRLEDLIGLEGVLKAEEQAAVEDWQPLVQEALDRALDDFEEARQREGQALAAEILGHAAAMEDLLRQLQGGQEELITRYRERLSQRVQDLLGPEHETLFDARRLEAELLIFADKAAIDEELTRLGSHVARIQELAQAEGAVGKQLDFLLQETLREINTIASKANDLGRTRQALELKHLCEKIREQAQNLE